MLIKSNKNKIIILSLFIPLLIIIAIFSLTNGTVEIAFSDVYDLLTKPRESSTKDTILFGLRFPRLLLGIGVGSSLALAGLLVQGIFRNPLVEPYTLGISGGASLGVAIAILLGIGATVYSFPTFAFMGAGTVSVIIWLSSIKRTEVSATKILLTGVMISFIASSTLALIFSVINTEQLHTLIFWTLGSLSDSNIYAGLFLLAFSLTSLLFSFYLAKVLNAFAFGEKEAAHLGINVPLSRFLILMIATLLTAFAVSLAGVIGFVGLIIPHLMRLIFGRNHAILVPATWLAGAGFLVSCDIITQTIAETPIPIGAVTGLIGGIVFIGLLTTNAGKKYV